jgi:hypothetical protein
MLTFLATIACRPKESFFSPFSSDGKAVAGKRGKERRKGADGCSDERDTPPGKPVASEVQNAEVISDQNAKE